MALKKFKADEIEIEAVAALNRLLTIICEQNMFEERWKDAIIKILLLNPSARLDRLADKLRNLEKICDQHEDLRSIADYSISMARKDEEEIAAGLKLFEELKSFEEEEPEEPGGGEGGGEVVEGSER